MCAKEISPQDTLKNSPLFRLSLSSKELFHSNFLEWLCYVDKNAFKKLINSMAGQEPDTDWGNKKWCVKREFNNFDLCIVAYDNNSTEDIHDDDEEVDDNQISHVLFVIENKVKSIPYKEQLIKYAQKVSKINKNTSDATYILLTLTQIVPDNLKGENPWIIQWTETKRKKEITKKCSWQVCSYSDYCEKIKLYYNQFVNEEETVAYLLNDYLSFIGSLTQLSNKWADDYSDMQKPFITNVDNYSIAKQLRIHDLYQKQKFSFLCTELYKAIKKDYNDYTVFPSNQGGLFKERLLTQNDNYICVNYAYLHGEPLLEINIHPASKGKIVEMYYAIQVQGNAYERGIQVKMIPDVQYEKTNKGRGKGKDNIAKFVWDNVIKQSNYQAIIEGWMKINESEWKQYNKDILQPVQYQKGEEPEYNAYNMLDGAYVYQKMTIIEDATIGQVLDSMLRDLQFVNESLKCQSSSNLTDAIPCLNQ